MSGFSVQHLVNFNLTENDFAQTEFMISLVVLYRLWSIKRWRKKNVRGNKSDFIAVERFFVIMITLERY
jgi:hypothetical protein